MLEKVINLNLPSLLIAKKIKNCPDPMFIDDGYGNGGNRGGDADNSGVDSNYIVTVVVLEGSGR